MALSSNDLFKAIGAPLKSVYSWGAIHSNGNVILRVWADECIKEQGQFMFRLTCYGKWDRNNQFQYKEREEHIRLIQEGTPGFMIVHTSQPLKEKCGARTITGCDRRIWEIDSIVEFTDEDDDEDLWGLVKGKPIDIPGDYNIPWTWFTL